MEQGQLGTRRPLPSLSGGDRAVGESWGAERALRGDDPTAWRLRRRGGERRGEPLGLYTLGPL